MTETSTKPYLIRAIYEWCVDNGYTPYVSVAVNARTQVPRTHVKGGEIVLNVSELATQGLQMGNDWIEFQARFGGVAQQISVPVEQVNAIFARENGQGMAFEVPKPLAEPEDEHSGHVLTALATDEVEPTGLAAVPVASESDTGPDSRPEGDSISVDSDKNATSTKKIDKNVTGKRKNHLTRVK